MPAKAKKHGQVDVGKSKPTKAAPAKTAKGAIQIKKQDEIRKRDAASRPADGEFSIVEKPLPRPTDAFDDLLEPFYHGKSLTDKIDTARDKWTLLPAFLKVKGLVKQHIDSFNHFIETELKEILRANALILSDVNEHFFLQYTNIRVGRPNRQSEDDLRNHISDITPNECRLRDMTYAAPIFVDYKYWRNGTTVSRKGTRIGRIPIMLRSSRCVLTGRPDSDMGKLQECAVDPGGYFIVKGQEKVILVQEQLSKNRVIVEAQKGIVQASVTSSTHERKSKTWVLLKKGKIYLRHHVVSEDIPIVIVLKAMGVQSDKDILTLVAGEDELYQDQFSPSFDDLEHYKVNTQKSALEFIGSRVRIKRDFNHWQNFGSKANHAIEALASVIITHVPVDGLDFRAKSLYIAFMVHRVLMAMHNPNVVDDRDYVGNKRLELAGQMLSLLFEDLFKRFNADLKTTVDKKLAKKNSTTLFDAHDILRSDAPRVITAGMERAISTGNWNMKRFKMERAGVSHVLSRLSYISALGMMTRISSQFEKTRKISGPRALQTSQFGMLCPSDTPEGEACGLMKNLALMTHITTDNKEDSVRNVFVSLGAQMLPNVDSFEVYKDGSYIVFINGTPIALAEDPSHFLQSFRTHRRTGMMPAFVNIHVNSHHNAIHIATDEGRICRPLIIVENGKSKVTKRSLKALRAGTMTFNSFLSEGVVEYLDVNEENDSNIAIYESDITDATTHLEIEPFTMLGAVAGLIPYPHHNQSPRNTYQCAMGKQAIGSIAYNQFTRIDTLLYLMVYPQKPLVKTRAIELVKYDKLPAGQNAIVAVMSYSGYDIEDALVLNKASCDRGFGRCQVFKKSMAHLRSYASGNADHLGARNPENAQHGTIGPDGIVDVGSRLKFGDVFMIKNTPTNTTASGIGSDYGDDSFQQTESTYRTADPSYVDKVMLSANEAETRVLKIHMRQTRRPEVGDKFSSRHGQKGVIGIVAEETDMPFTDEGIKPDIIMNPHGFPSRMTVGKMLELISGKAGVIRGTYEYGTAFGGSKIEDMGKVLSDHGFSYSGKDYMTCGITGEPLSAYIFHGPIYYQKLKHMVQDKTHARSTGTRAMLSRQPMEGRARGGGLRLGEMERDCLIAYGASQLLLERLMLSSDKHQCEVCEYCGGMGYSGWCQSCKTGEGLVRMVLPYAAKLLVQELMSMGIKATFKLGDHLSGE